MEKVGGLSMSINSMFAADREAILSHRWDQGADNWTTSDLRLIKGAPFSMMECVQYLMELGMSPNDPILQTCAGLILDTWRQDGSFQLVPHSTVYPCHTAHAAEVLSRMGYASDPRLSKTFEHLMRMQQTDGGWKCNKFSYGHGPETEFSNPFPTLIALDAFRLAGEANRNPSLDRAVDFLLEHWTIRKPIGPCHYGIGTLFMQVEYPFRNYNLFVYVYVLSFFDRAKRDPRFLDAWKALQAKTVDGQIVVERVVPKLASLAFCKKGSPSALATKRYQEIIENIG